MMTGHMPSYMKHTVVSKSDLENAGNVNTEPVSSYWTPEQMDAYFKEKYPNLKQPTKSDGTPMSRAFSGFDGERAKKNQRRAKGGAGA